MAEFAAINGNKDKVWPKAFDSEADNKSAGFVPPYKVGTGVTRGTQTVINTDGSKMTIGIVPGTTELGMAFYDSAGHIVSKYVGPTRFVYNVEDSNNNNIQDGRLPDGSYGFVIVKEGSSVEDVFS